MTLKYEHTVLFVDDEPSILKSLKRLFRKEGYRMLTAPGGEDGLKLIKDSDQPMSLIISDQRMPIMNGAEFLEHAKSMCPDAVRILLTGYSDMDAIVDAVNKGEIHRYFTKPWNDHDLVLQVRKSLEQYELVLENRRLTELTQSQNLQLAELNQGLEAKVKERTEALARKNDELIETNRQLHRSFLDTVRLLASLIESLNPLMGRHMKQAARTAKAVAGLMDIQGEELENIELAAMIHDMGLIGTPEPVCIKDMKEMNDEEYQVFIQHPIIASVSLESVERMRIIGEIILHHHECYDGSGFPVGLKGDRIPVGSRIIGPVSDYVRLMESWPQSFGRILGRAKKLMGSAIDSVYMNDRGNLVPELTRKILQNRSGRMYDPEVVHHLLSWVESQTASGVTEDRKDVVHVPCRELKAGMITGSELRTKDGRFVLAADTVLTRILIRGLERLSKARAIESTLPVRLE